MPKILGVHTKARYETASYIGFISRNGTTTQIKLKTLEINTTSALIQIDNSGDHTRYTFLKACQFSASASSTGSASSGNVGISYYNSAGTRLKYVVGGVGPSGQAAGTMTALASPGDYIVMTTETTVPSDVISTNFSVNALEIIN